MSISRALVAEKPATKRPRSFLEGPRGGKASCKKSKKMYMVAAPCARARPSPPSSRGGLPSARAGFFLHIYLSISTYLSLYNIYIYIDIHTSLNMRQIHRLPALPASGRSPLNSLNGPRAPQGLVKRTPKPRSTTLNRLEF